MNDVTYIILILTTTLGSLFGIAYWLQRRSKSRAGLSTYQPADRLGKTWSWFLRVSAIILVLLVAATFIFHNLLFLWIALAIVALRYIPGSIYRIYRISKMK